MGKTVYTFSNLTAHGMAKIGIFFSGWTFERWVDMSRHGWTFFKEKIVLKI